ncbi:MAG: biotin--[acetyl-CoA-carboxylase] ligase [Deltaproteobacteria bacterium]|nr:biotin--[acetyl-CoA-carboxylase] ligase [Deltaproteobacteria bacterium]
MARPASPELPARPLEARQIQAALTTRLLGHGKLLRIVPRLGSTNLVLLEEARLGLAGEGTVLLAEEQTGGRGRGDHRWESPPGMGLYLSALLRPTLPPERLGLVTLACGVAVCETCAQAGVCAQLRWPNDVLVRGRKLAGILCELVSPPSRTTTFPTAGPGAGRSAPADGEEALLVVAGIGLNVALDPATLPPPLDAQATSLLRERQQCGPAAAGRAAAELLPLDRSLLAAHLLDRLEQRLDQCAGAPTALLAAWEQRWPDRRRRVEVLDGPVGIPEGTAIGVSESGALLLLDVPGRPGVVQLLSGSARALEP